MEEKIKEILDRRKNRDSLLGYIPVIECSKVFDIAIIKRRNLYGLMFNDGRFLIVPIYDKINIIGDSGLIALIVSDRMALFSLKNRKIISDFDCEKIITHDKYDSLEFVFHGKHGLWDKIGHRMVIPPEYDEVTCRTDHRFLWAYKDNHYCFIEKNTTRVINVSNALDVYDSKHGMFIVSGETGNVIMLNYDGFRDTLTLRRLVKNNQGRLTLRNTKKGLKDIIDVYGRILNG